MEHQIPKGLFDILPSSKEIWKESDKWQYLESTARELASDYNYQEIRTPIFEHTDLFLRGMGSYTDVISKELYTFLDKAQRSMSLRPEATASVVRAFLETNLFEQPKPLKLFYIGPMFRYDRPQKGRFRQFHQFGIEVIGEPSPEIDAETIDMLLELFRRLEIKNTKLLINSIGDLLARQNYIKALQDYLKPSFSQLSKESQARYSNNPLRILDSKEENDQKLLESCPSILDFLSEKSKKHFDHLLRLLTDLNIKYEINDRLVRGLDYYNDTIYEIISEELGGAQNSLGGGGRYDSLVKTLGGPDTAGTGYACGMERILQTMVSQEVYFPKKKSPFVFIIPLCEEALKFSIILTKDLRHHQIPAEIDINAKKIQKSLRSAIKLEARNALIIGNDEMNNKKAQFKDLRARQQTQIDFDDIKIFIRDKYYQFKEQKEGTKA